jgi:predicted PurR-regulated permease PerM
MLGFGDASKRPPRKVNPRDVWTILWVALLFAVTLFVLYEVRRVLVWIFVALFAASVLSPVVGLLVRRGVKRGLAVGLVIVALLVVGGGVTYAFVKPLVNESVKFADDLPSLVDDVRNAPVVKNILERFNVQDKVNAASADLPHRLIGLSGPILSAFKTVGELLIAALTIFVLTIFLLLYGPTFFEGLLAQIHDPDERTRVRELGSEMLRAVSGWVAGNVVTSIIAGVVSMIFFFIVGLPYVVLLSLWVGIADLIPLVGATLGAIPAIIVGFVNGVPTGIAVLVYFIVYQQLENHILQPYIYGRTIQLNPFVVLVSVLIGVELAGFLGALFALPVAGAVNVLVAFTVRERARAAEAKLLTPEAPSVLESARD